MSGRGSTSRVRAGFTLAELMVVVLIMSIVAVTVVPTLASVSRMREGGARDEVARMLHLARGLAAAGGGSCGLHVSPSKSTLTVLEIEPDGDIAEKVDPVTGRARAANITAMFGGVGIDSFTNGDGSVGEGTVWFDYQGVPHIRDGDGVFVAESEDEAEIVLSSGVRIIVYPRTGTTEVR